MKSLSIAGLAGLATLGAQAQTPSALLSHPLDPVVVTATRGFSPASTLREAVVITRADLDDAGPLTLGEVLQRRAGIELRATGGAGQPQTLFIRGAGTAQTLVLVDGMRVGSATIGTTSIEHIPLELIERIEVIKGPMSSLYGPEAIGGVIQIFTRGKPVPHLFVTSAYGSDNDRRLSAGITTVEGGTRLTLSAGGRKVDSPSATNARAPFGHNPDDDPYENTFFNVRASQKFWQGETLELEAFSARGKTHYDGGSTGTEDRSEHTISGARFTSSAPFADWWSSRIALGQGRDRLRIRGDFPSSFETRQDQASWVNEFKVPAGTIVAGAETVRQKVISDTEFTRTRRDTHSAFVGLNEAWAGQRLEASARRDQDEQFGHRNTGSASYGIEYPSIARLSATYARGFRVPTFFDLYASFPGYTPNPALRPEESRSIEYALRSDPAAALQWRVTSFDHRFENLIVFSFAEGTVLNVARARARGIEASIEASWLGARWRASFTAQRPRDEDTGKRLQGRAERYGTLDASRRFGAWNAGLTVVASGPRFDSIDESPATRLGGYATVDARLRYTFAKHWSAEVAATNLGDRRIESVVGYDAPRRAVMLSVRFEAF